MQLDGGFGFTELGPWEDGKAEINNRGIKQVKLTVELEPMFGSKLAATLQQFIENGLIQGCRLLFINPGQCGS